MAVNPSPFGPKPQFELSDGTPAVGNKLFFYVAGSVNTKQNTYTNSTGGVANANPIILNTLGTPSTEIWFTAGQSYKVVYAPSTDTDPPTSPIWTIDNLIGINDTTNAASEWIAGPAPTFVSATSFTLVGDQTSTFTPGRRLKTTNTGGTIYSTIVTSVFGVVTTVTVANDSGSIDSGLSAVSYGLISAANPSISAEMMYRKGTAVVSASTTNIWNIVGDFVHVTGTTTITSLGTAPYAGDQRTVIFDGILTLTHNSTSLQCPGSQSITTAAGDRAIVRADTTANMIVVKYDRALGSGPAVPRGQLAGLTMSTAGTSATMTVAAGQAADSTNSVLMNLASAISKTTSAWAVGSGNGGIDTGAIANGTWYHFYEIMRSDTGVVDVLFSLSASAPTMPANYTFKRRIGSGLTNGSAQWTLFKQLGDKFTWDIGVNDVAAATNPGTSAVTRTLTVPTGLVLESWFSNYESNQSNNRFVLWTALDQTDSVPSAAMNSLNVNLSAGNLRVNGEFFVKTNTSAQIRYRTSASGASDETNVVTKGWIDRRGRDD